MHLFNVRSNPLFLNYILFGLVLLIAVQPAHAADFNASDERQSTAIRGDAAAATIEESKTSGFRAASNSGQKNSYQLGALSGVYGGNLSATIRWYRDIDNQDTAPDFLRWALQEKASVWTSFAVQNTRGYVLGSMANTDRGTGPTYTGIGADVEGPTLDLAYLASDFSETHNLPLRLISGRQVQYVGRGLTYYGVNDGFQVEVKDDLWPQKYFIAKTPPRQDNIDFSVPGFDKEGDRFFYGSEVGYNGFSRISLYAYALGQSDQSAENPDDIRQNYRYDSFYYGGGFAARPSDGLQLWGELVGETGTGHTDRLRSRPQETTVDAWAWIMGGKYQFAVPTRPAIETEAAYGSGDPDRILVTNTINGSADERDTNFLYFGYYAAGYALQPRLSNLYVYSAGLNFQPLENHPAFKRFAVGGKAYLYYKDERDGGTSDFESAGRESDLGTEWDLYIHWQVLQGLLWSLRYGVFIPRHGFLANQQDPTQFLSSRLSWDF